MSVFVLDELKAHGLVPKMIISTPDKPKGRKLVMTPSVVTNWALENNIEVLRPVSLKNNQEIVEILQKGNYQYFLVASYGKLIPSTIFDIPEKKTINIHPSLLPKYRGASPVQAQILEDEKEVGVSIMLIDEEMDHGPLLAQEKVQIEMWPLGRIELEKILAKRGALLFLQTIENWILDNVTPQTQDESKVILCKKIIKEDGLLNISNLDYKQFLKIKAFEGWPGTFFLFDTGDKKIRVIVKEALWKDCEVEITKVLPEGKTLMLYKDFLRGYNR